MSDKFQMKFAKICIALAAIIAAASFSLLREAPARQAGQATPQPNQSEIDSADRLFKAGKFADAGTLTEFVNGESPSCLEVRPTFRASIKIDNHYESSQAI